MAKAISKRQLAIYEVETEDGGTALQFGDGPLQMGVGESDLMRLLSQVFDMPESPSHIDAELYDIANLYLDEDAARERYEELRG